jgi:aspartyl-tRNA(Asn)/glutamyl-tRNA(Gln) amidotransferase subunit C
MALDKETVRRIAHLARLKVPEADLEGLAGELNNILTWVEQLDALDTSDVAPMTSVVVRDLPMREDEVTDGGHADRILANAPDPARGFFTVPKVVE